jgi:hypothetical protein
MWWSGMKYTFGMCLYFKQHPFPILLLSLALDGTNIWKKGSFERRGGVDRWWWQEEVKEGGEAVDEEVAEGRDG